MKEKIEQLIKELSERQKNCMARALTYAEQKDYVMCAYHEQQGHQLKFCINKLQEIIK